MKKVREIPPEWQDRVAHVQSEEYQARLRTLVAEEGQSTLATSFMCGREDDGAPLVELDREILRSCLKPIPSDWGTRHSIWEEGDEVCYSYGKMTLRGLIRWRLHTVAEGTWLLPDLTESGEATMKAA